MKKLLAMLLALVMVLSFAACTAEEEPNEPVESQPENEEPVEEPVEPNFVWAPSAEPAAEGWAPDVEKAINDFIAMYGKDSATYAEGESFVVFDFDNTCSIFDVEEQLAIYQLQTMSFAFGPDKIAEVLATDIGLEDGNLTTDLTDLGYGNGSYQDWIDDITAAYTILWDSYGPFTPAGLSEEKQAEIQADDQWKEFATKMRAMYDLVYDHESASVAYPWVLYWFTGMTEDEVYALASGSHSKYGALETSEENWTTPETIESKVGVVTYDWTSGTVVSDQVKGLWKLLDENGIDVWVCSASATDPIRAAVDVFGLHDYITGLTAMTNVMEDGKYVNKYDYETGCAWLNDGNGGWVRDTLPTKSQTQGVGKVTAVVNAIMPKYNNVGPLAGFMDSTGDYNFCTEFANLKLVINFNRASRKVTDGGGVISAIAVYEKEFLGYDLATANAAGDTLYVLQGREENGKRCLRVSNATMTLGAEEEKLFKNEDNFAQLEYIINNNMTVEDAINTFAMKTAADAEGNVLGIKYGFLKEYAGYHNIG